MSVTGEDYDTACLVNYALGYESGAAVAFGLVAMAEAIRRRPTYSWKVVVSDGRMAHHSWEPSQAKAMKAAKRYQAILGKDSSLKITRVEHPWCEECAEREVLQSEGDPSP